MFTTFKQLSLFIILLSSFSYIHSQESDAGKKYVTKTFNATKLINLQTTQGASPKSFTFNIQHRFGKTHFRDDFLKNFMGIDLSSNIRFGFNIPVTSKIYIGVGRTKYGKNYDASLNYNLVQQTKDNSQPVAVSVYGNISYMSDDFPEIENNWSFEDGSEFKYKESHRIAYYTQLSVSRKMNDWLSLLVSPVYVHNNLSDEEYKNDYFIFPVAGKIKTGFSSGIIFEYSFIMDKPESQNQISSLGFEIGTASHTFQITASTTRMLTGQNIYTTTSESTFDDGYFFLGFNIFRTFYIKK